MHLNYNFRHQIQLTPVRIDQISAYFDCGQEFDYHNPSFEALYSPQEYVHPLHHYRH